MKTLLLSLTLFFGTIWNATDTSMLGLKINDSEKAVEQIKLQIIASDKSSKNQMVKFRTENGNDFSITTRKGKVVYMENDWLQNPQGRTPLITNFRFGETSLKDIRNSFGTNGFTYSDRSYLKTQTDLIMFNCFELDSPNNEVLVTITKISLNAEVTESNVAENLKLDALILSDSKFLDQLWGKKKVYDKNYKRIKL